MKLPEGHDIPIGSIGAGKIDFYNDLTVGNATIANNWSNPIRVIRGFHIFDLESGTLLQGKSPRLGRVWPKPRFPKRIEAYAAFPEVTYIIEDPDFEVKVYSPFVPGDLRDSSLPAIVFRVRGRGIIAISFPNLAGSRRWGRLNKKASRGGVSGVLMTNSRARPNDPAYGELFLGCRGCRACTEYRVWVPSPVEETMVDDLSVFSLERLEACGDVKEYRIQPYAREEIAGIVWKRVEGEERFYLTWYFNGRPHHYPYGHYYENWFQGAVEVAEYVDEKGLGVELGEAGDWLDDAIRNSLYVITYSWLTKDGRFAIYEDPEVSLLMNTIGSMTWDGASFALLEYFPELVKRVDEYYAGFIRDGEVPHDFGEESLDDPIYGASYSYPWSDLGPTWVLLIYRDYLFTGDRGILERNYGKMKEVIDWLIGRDLDGDGLPDSRGGFDNSYDGTYMLGASSYVGFLFACALRAFIEASKILGRDASAYEKALERARSALESLWNGKYFIAWRSRDRENMGCLSSQLLGQLWCDLLGLGDLVDSDKIVKALKSIYKLNYKASHYCTVNLVKPDGSIDESTEQTRTCWPRVSFALAAHMILRGLVEEGIEVARREWNTISSKYPYNQPSRIDPRDGSHTGLPYYIGSPSIYLVKLALKMVSSRRSD